MKLKCEKCNCEEDNLTQVRIREEEEDYGYKALICEECFYLIVERQS